uniref:Uncharacterized protein n=1 Tax=Myoviridae sp. ct3OK4 TaxID=2825024 RepID=A0A8S5NY88_9CAUD|nr:MAG TPA: hypothetical protein [Myoviridae sp. ct3OK4]
MWAAPRRLPPRVKSTATAAWRCKAAAAHHLPAM